MDNLGERCDVAVVGGGLLGLALARELLAREPRSRVFVLEREARIAAHQSGHNSGVIHAGVYYAPGSRKAQLCVEGARDLYRFCEKHGVAHQRCGKLIVATGTSELERLETLERRARQNGVAVKRISAAEIGEFEPHAEGVGALYSPDTGIVDYVSMAHALATDFREMGGRVATGCGVHTTRAQGRTVRIEHQQGTLEASRVIVCAGAWSDRLAIEAGADPDPRIVPFRGAYLRLRPARRELVRALIYPVPDPNLPFLGVHFTRTVHDEVLIGPTALLSLSRGEWGSTWRDGAQTLAWPGTWRLLGHHWRAAGGELVHALSRASVVRAGARYVPALGTEDVESAFTGVRAQALSRDGTLVDDFAFSVTARTLHVRNAPSPGATASLAIARWVADEATRVLG